MKRVAGYWMTSPRREDCEGDAICAEDTTSARNRVIIGAIAAMDTCIVIEDGTVRKSLLSNWSRAFCSAA